MFYNPAYLDEWPERIRFIQKIQVTVRQCWEWTASRHPKGYGQFRYDGMMRKAHRYAYMRLVGSIPDGLCIDHKCRNRACVNPEHLEVVTFRENTLRGEAPAAKQARQTHCRRGHELAGSNLRMEGRHRRCRACVAIRMKR